MSHIKPPRVFQTHFNMYSIHLRLATRSRVLEELTVAQLVTVFTKTRHSTMLWNPVHILKPYFYGPF